MSPLPQESKRYLTHPNDTAQTLVTDISITESQSLKHDHLPIHFGFIGMPRRIVYNDRESLFYVVI